MKFFIDYENVRGQGFRGVEFLRPEDEVVLFYSKVCMKIEKGILDKIFDSGCQFRIVRTENGGKNAMDFCIVSDISDILGQGYRGDIGIVSRDKDYKVFQNFWLARIPKMKIICKPDIAQCILSTNDTGCSQWQDAHLEYVSMDLEKQYELFVKRRQLQSLLEEILANSDLEGRLEEVAKDLAHRQTGRETYLALMRLYGVVNGLAFYQVLKKVG